MAATVKIGTRFHYLHADSQPEWEVMKSRGGDTWECVVVPNSPDWAGTKKVFGGEEIRGAIQSQDFWENMGTAQVKWWKSRKPGETVHYANGFGQFVRGVIVTDDGENKMRSTALVGNWSAHDLPHIDAAGNLVEGYHVRQIREGGKLMQPNLTSMVEANGVRDGDTDPRGQEALDLRPPGLNGEQEEAKRLNGIRELAAAALAVKYDATKPFSETLRDALKAVRQLLNEADL